jgi:leader peptidase (prepilin peptidase)/N-methyltransferase
MLAPLTIDAIRIALIVTLLYLAYVDLRTFRLPNSITFPLIFLGLIFNFYSTARLTNFSDAATGSAVGYIFIWGLNEIYRRFKQRHGIGMGDAKLLAALGAWLGLAALVNILFLASMGGIIGGLVWLKIHQKSIRSAFPFGPFIAIAGIIELLWPQLLQTHLLNNLI